MATKASDLVGNSFRLKKDVTAYEGRPNSSRKSTWKSGTQTPLVYSWVERDGGLWWQFGRQDPIRFIKHDPAALDPVAERGAADYLDAELGGDRGRDPMLSGLDIFGNISGSQFATPFKILAYLIAIYLGFKIYEVLK